MSTPQPPADGTAAALPDDRFPLPENFGPASVWADRTGHRTLVGRNQRGVQIPIGMGPGEVSPGELLKIALVGCAGMSSDFSLQRRLGEDFAMRLFVHDTSDADDDRYTQLGEEVQLDLEGLTDEEIARVRTVMERAIAASCTVERTIVPGVRVTHRLLGAPEHAADDTAGEQPA